MAQPELRRLIYDLGRLPAAMKAELRPALRRGAEPTRKDAQRRAGWSTRIPAATRIRVGLGGATPGVSLRVSSAAAPHARPYEHVGRRGTFPHPAYGQVSHPWVEQASRPFLWPAFRANADEVSKELDETVVSIARRYGWS